jgi:hypothetical protein
MAKAAEDLGAPHYPRSESLAFACSSAIGLRFDAHESFYLSGP